MWVRGGFSEEHVHTRFMKTHGLLEKPKESDELEILSILVKEYENKYYSISRPNPIEAIKFRLEQVNISEAQLAEILGYRSRKSEILSGKRKLSLSMIRGLHKKLHIPAEALIAEY